MPKRLSNQSVTDFAAGVTHIADNEVPLAEGLRALAGETNDRQLAVTFAAVADAVERGATFEEALQLQSDRLPEHVQGLALAGMRSGRLAEIFAQYVSGQYAVAALRRRVWAALAYPAILLVLVTALVVFIQGYVVSEAAELYNDFGFQLPLVTRIALSFSGARAWSALGALAALAVAWLALRAFYGAALTHRVLTAAPVVGPLWRFTSLCQFSRLLALLLREKVPLPESLRLAAEGVGDDYLRSGCQEVIASVEQGASLSDACLRAAGSPVPSRRWYVGAKARIHWSRRSKAPATCSRAARSRKARSSPLCCRCWRFCWSWPSCCF